MSDQQALLKQTQEEVRTQLRTNFWNYIHKLRISGSQATNLLSMFDGMYELGKHVGENSIIDELFNGEH